MGLRVRGSGFRVGFRGPIGMILGLYYLGYMGIMERKWKLLYDRVIKGFGFRGVGFRVLRFRFRLRRLRFALCFFCGRV